MYSPELKTSQLRDKLMSQGLHSADMQLDPIKQFELWYKEICTTDLPESSAMIFGTDQIQFGAETSPEFLEFLFKNNLGSLNFISNSKS